MESIRAMEGDLNESLCQLCNVSSSKYICPRCNISYCSVDCYKSPHHADCSEAFYKENVQEWLAAEGPDSKSKSKMVDILKRINESQSDEIIGYDEDSDEDSDEEDSLAERLAHVDMDNPDDLWAKLLPEERKEFIDLVNSGDVAKLIPEWEPWWEKKHPLPKVRFVDDISEPEYVSTCPKIRPSVPFSTLTKTEPSPQVYFNLVNVLASYSIVARYMNGDFNELPSEAATIMINVSKNLASNAIFNDFESAVESVNQCVIDCPLITLEPDPKRVVQLSNDVKLILEGPNEKEPLFYTKAALSGFIELLMNARNPKRPRCKGIFSSAFPEPTGACPSVDKATLVKCVKKIEYYLSWTDEHLNKFHIK